MLGRQATRIELKFDEDIQEHDELRERLKHMKVKQTLPEGNQTRLTVYRTQPFLCFRISGKSRALTIF